MNIAQKLLILVCLATAIFPCYAQKNLNHFTLVISSKHKKKKKTDYIAVDDKVSIKSWRGKKNNITGKRITEITETEVIVKGPDTIAIKEVKALKLKELGLPIIKTGFTTLLLGSAAFGGFVGLTYSESEGNWVFAGQLLFISFAAFAIPFGLINLTAGLLKNSKSYKIGEEWELNVVANY